VSESKLTIPNPRAACILAAGKQHQPEKKLHDEKGFKVRKMTAAEARPSEARRWAKGPPHKHSDQATKDPVILRTLKPEG
jgi:hypothetical protein